MFKKKKVLTRDNITDDDIFGEEDLVNSYESFLNERAAILPPKEEMELVEERIRTGVLNMFKKAKIDALSNDEDKGFFRYEDLYAIPHVEDYFAIVMANGDRNIGKSTSSKRMLRDTVANNRRFMWWRNIDDEVEAQLASDMDEEKGFLPSNGWTYEGKAKSPNIVDMQGKTVGFYRPLNTSAKYKSTDFPNVDLIVYEEYNEVNISKKYYKMVKMISTVQRFNPRLKVILQANFTDQNDEVLQGLGMGLKKYDPKRDFCIFNWEVGSLIINIPKGVYRQPKNKKNDIALRASYGDYETYQSQFGGGFDQEEPVNIIDEKEFDSITPVFNILFDRAESINERAKSYSAFKMTLYNVVDNECNTHQVLMDTRGKNDAPIFIYDYLNSIRYPQAIMLEPITLDRLIKAWQAGNLKTVNMKTHVRVVALFANAKKYIDKTEKFLIEDIENVVE